MNMKKLLHILKSQSQSAGKYTLVGVVSYGWGCASSTPGIYARVQGFLPWIKNLISSGECSGSSSGSSGGATITAKPTTAKPTTTASSNGYDYYSYYGWSFEKNSLNNDQTYWLASELRDWENKNCLIIEGFDSHLSVVEVRTSRSSIVRSLGWFISRHRRSYWLYK